MKKILLLLCACVGLAACHKHDPEEEPAVVRTVLFYLVADNSLSSHMQHDVEKVYDGLVASNTACDVLIFWDGSESNKYWPQPCILHYKTDGKGRVNGKAALTSTADKLTSAVVLKQYDSCISTDRTVMTRVLSDMVSLSSSSHYGLVMESHGSNWLPTITGASRSFGQDGAGSNNTILIPDLVDAIQSSGCGRLDYVLLDACLMGSAEVAYEFRRVTDYLIGSAIEVPAYGFPYENLMWLLGSESVADYTEHVCQSFMDYYLRTSTSFAASSVIKCSEIEQLAAAFRTQLAMHREQVDAFTRKDVAELQQYARYAMTYSSVDMLDYIRALNEGTVPADFQAAFDKVVLFKNLLPDCYLPGSPFDFDENGSLSVSEEHYSGLGVYIPVASKTDWNHYFQTIGWFTAAGWNQTVWAN